MVGPMFTGADQLEKSGAAFGDGRNQCDEDDGSQNALG